MFSMGSPHVEVGLNTSTIALRAVGGDKKGSLESETINYGHNPTGLEPRNDCLARASSNCNDRPVLSSETAPNINKPATV
jgi:hypothetical protein